MYKFKNTNCVNCHNKLPKTKVEPSDEVEMGRVIFKVGDCPKCGAPQRLVEEATKPNK